MATRNQVSFPKNSTNTKTFDVHRFVEVNVEAAQNHFSTDWIAEQMGMSRSSVNAKRSELRTAGVVLPDLQKGRAAQEIDVASLNKVIDDLKNPAPARGSRQRRHAGSTAS